MLKVQWVAPFKKIFEGGGWKGVLIYKENQDLICREIHHHGI